MSTTMLNNTDIETSTNKVSRLSLRTQQTYKQIKMNTEAKYEVLYLSDDSDRRLLNS